jgi:hypothetical protein
LQVTEGLSAFSVSASSIEILMRRILPTKKLLMIIHTESSIEIGYTLKFMSEMSYK